jgi:hypothetical protein
MYVLICVYSLLYVSDNFTFKKNECHWVQWYMPVISGTQEVKTG